MLHHLDEVLVVLVRDDEQGLVLDVDLDLVVDGLDGGVSDVLVPGLCGDINEGQAQTHENYYAQYMQ